MVGLIAVAVAVSIAGGFEARQSRPSRIVSLVPAVTEILFAIGAGDAVVGVSTFDNYPPEARTRTRVGALIDPDVERILSLKPDLVVVYGSQDELIGRLERASVPAFRYRHAALADVTETIRAVGGRVGHGPAADALAARIEREIAEVRKAAAAGPRPRTAIVFDREPGTLRGTFASAGYGFMHDMLEAAGGVDVFGDIKRERVQATAELLLARAPDVIIEVHGGAPWPPAKIASELKVWSALSSIPAVRNRRVHIIVDDRLAVPGPRVAEAVRVLREVLVKSEVRSQK
jgi:iron complex transport system substrate-binding protein